MTDKINHRMAKIGKTKTDTGTHPVVHAQLVERPRFCSRCSSTKSVVDVPRFGKLCKKCNDRRLAEV